MVADNPTTNHGYREQFFGLAVLLHGDGAHPLLRVRDLLADFERRGHHHVLQVVGVALEEVKLDRGLHACLECGVGGGGGVGGVGGVGSVGGVGGLVMARGGACGC